MSQSSFLSANQLSWQTILEVSFCHSPLLERLSPNLAVGKLVHRSQQQLAGTLSRTIDPFHVVATHRTHPGTSSSQPLTVPIRLDTEDIWTLSRGLLLVRSI